METRVYCTFQYEGLHRWEDTGNYLQHPHRHMFHFRVDVSVEHDDREIEFIALRRNLLEYAREVLGTEVRTASCEMIAKDMIEFLEIWYPGHQYYVEVSEDGENGAVVTHDGRQVPRSSSTR